MKTILSMLFLCFSLAAQCGGTYPALVFDAPGPYNAGCNNMTSTPGAIPPWSSPIQWISAGSGGNLTVTWSDFSPPPFPSPIYEVVVLLDVALLPAPVFVSPGSACTIIVGGGLLFLPATINNSLGCPVTFIGVVPPMPSLQGLTIYGQGVMRDPLLPLSWATTNAWQFTL